MKNSTFRSNLMALRERYLWLWQQLNKLETRLKNSPTQAEPELRKQLWTERMRRQLRRYWP